MNDPLVSVVLATYNRAEYIKKAIKSVLNQAYENIELIIVDDCSTDSTLKLISTYKNSGRRIVIVKNKINLGFPKSLNRGIDSARGKYIARIDDDDCWIDKDKLAKQARFLEAHPDYVLAGGGGIIINKEGKETDRYLLPEKDEEIRKRLLFDNCFIHSSVIFRKQSWQKASGYSERFGIDCDWALWLEMGKLGKVYNFQEYFICYLKGSQNSSNFHVRKNLKDKIKMIKIYRADYPGYKKARLLRLFYYLSSFLPYRRRMRPILTKIKSLIFR